MITVAIDHRLTLSPREELPPQVVERLKERLTMLNPAWVENEKRGFSNWRTPMTLSFYQENADCLVMPRGFIGQLVWLLKEAGVSYQLDRRTRRLPEVDFQFVGQLKEFQAEAVEAVLRRDFGTLSASTGSGKTVMALAVMARRRQPALIVVHTKELLHQWLERIESFLGICAQEAGVLGDGRQVLGPRITVALVQTLYKCAAAVAPHIGFLVVDECHHAPARAFTEAVTAFDAQYMLGLSATPWRRDGLTKLIYWHLGSKVHEIGRRVLVEDGHLLEAEVIIRQTDFAPRYDPSEEYSRMLSELADDPARNALIVGDVAREARDGEGVCLVLTDRKAHCETLAAMLAARGVQAAVLTGDLSNNKRQEIVASLHAGEVKVLIATGQLIGEGFDCPELSTLFLATPIRFSGRVLQYLGRVLRPAPGKDKARVYDYLDARVGVLINAARARARVYAAAER